MNDRNTKGKKQHCNVFGFMGQSVSFLRGVLGPPYASATKKKRNRLTKPFTFPSSETNRVPSFIEDKLSTKKKKRLLYVHPNIVSTLRVKGSPFLVRIRSNDNPFSLFVMPRGLNVSLESGLLPVVTDKKRRLFFTESQKG